jgi:O-antigen/teichoic acid export membrane protein
LNFKAIKNLGKGNRSLSAVIGRNIVTSFFIKGLGMLISFLLVPFTISLLNAEKYGLWITIFSIVSWFSMLDIGLGNGFRNKFVDAVAKGKTDLAKSYVNSFYSSMAIITLVLLTVGEIGVYYTNWTSILNLSLSFNENIKIIMMIVFGLFSVQLFSNNITIILMAVHKSAIRDSLVLINNVLIFCGIYLAKIYDLTSLLSIAFIFMIVPIFVNLIASLIFFSGILGIYRPSSFKILKHHLRSFFNLGIKFFIIQITALVLFTSSNLIITKLFGSAEVTPYNVAYRLFSVGLVFFTIIMNPFWSGFTHAFAEKSFLWIKQTINKLIRIWVLFSFIVCVVVLFSQKIFTLWVGDAVSIPMILSIQFGLFTILTTWTLIFNQFLSGVGDVKLMLRISVVQLICAIPLILIFAHTFKFGTVGVIAAINVILLIGAILMPIKSFKILNQKINTDHA